jgi:hypothetical protein
VTLLHLKKEPCRNDQKSLRYNAATKLLIFNLNRRCSIKRGTGSQTSEIQVE